MSKKTLTQRQQKLLDIISENLGNKGSTKSMYKMMLEAGYSESSAKQQSTLLAGIEDELDSIVSKLEKARDRAIERLEETVGKAEYRDLSNAIDKFTKQIQLLSGEATERHSVELQETREQLKNIFNGEKD